MDDTRPDNGSTLHEPEALRSARATLERFGVDNDAADTGPQNFTVRWSRELVAYVAILQAQSNSWLHLLKDTRLDALHFCPVTSAPCVPIERRYSNDITYLACAACERHMPEAEVTAKDLLDAVHDAGHAGAQADVGAYIAVYGTRTALEARVRRVLEAEDVEGRLSSRELAVIAVNALLEHK